MIITPKKISKEDRDDALELLANGFTWREVAAKFDISQMTLSRWQRQKVNPKIEPAFLEIASEETLKNLMHCLNFIANNLKRAKKLNQKQRKLQRHYQAIMKAFFS